MAERVKRAAARFDQVLEGGPTLSVYQLHKGKQRAIFKDTGAFLRAVADKDTWLETHWCAGRIGAPPRTGKTVIAGQIIAATQMVTTYVVPTKTLVKQAEQDLLAQLPGVPIGTYYSDGKRLVQHGVNITPYAMIAGLYRRHGCLPPEIANS